MDGDLPKDDELKKINAEPQNQFSAQNYGPEKPYYLMDNKDHIKIQQEIKKENKGNWMDRYKNIKITKYLAKVYFILIFEYTNILILSWFGFEVEFNKELIYEDRILGFTFATSFLMSGVFIGFVITLVKCEFYEKKILLLFHIPYIILVSFYMYLLSYLTEPKIILCGLCIIILEFISLELFVIISGIYSYLGLFISPLVVSIISVPIFNYLWINHLMSSIKIFSVTISGVFYLGLINFFCLHKINSTDFPIASNIFSLAIFTPIVVATILVMAFFGGGGEGSSD